MGVAKCVGPAGKVAAPPVTITFHRAPPQIYNLKFKKKQTPTHNPYGRISIKRGYAGTVGKLKSKLLI